MERAGTESWFTPTRLIVSAYPNPRFRPLMEPVTNRRAGDFHPGYKAWKSHFVLRSVDRSAKPIFSMALSARTLTHYAERFGWGRRDVFHSGEVRRRRTGFRLRANSPPGLVSDGAPEGRGVNAARSQADLHVIATQLAKVLLRKDYPRFVVVKIVSGEDMVSAISGRTLTLDARRGCCCCC